MRKFMVNASCGRFVVQHVCDQWEAECERNHYVRLPGPLHIEPLKSYNERSTWEPSFGFTFLETTDGWRFVRVTGLIE